MQVMIKLLNFVVWKDILEEEAKWLATCKELCKELEKVVSGIKLWNLGGKGDDKLVMQILFKLVVKREYLVVVEWRL